MLIVKWSLIVLSLAGLVWLLMPVMPYELEVHLAFDFDPQEMTAGQAYDVEIAVCNGLRQPVTVHGIDAT